MTITTFPKVDSPLSPYQPDPIRWRYLSLGGSMRRREFIAGLGGAAVMSLAASAQERARRVGVLIPGTADNPDLQARVGAFLQGLGASGWTIGQNVRIDIRWATTNAGEVRRYAAELATLAPDVILAHGGAAVGALLQATRTVPIVFPVVGDPVGAGYVDSLARPGGNVTGFMLFEFGIGREMAGTAQEDCAEHDASGGPSGSQPRRRDRPVGRIQSVAPSLGVEVNPVNMRDASEIERAVAAFARDPNGGLIVTASGLAHRSSRSDHCACGPAQAARGLLRTLLRRRRRPGLLRA